MTAFAWHTFLEGLGVLAATVILYRCWRHERRERAYHRRYLARVARRNEDRWWALWRAGVRDFGWQRDCATYPTTLPENYYVDEITYRLRGAQMRAGAWVRS